MRRFRKNYLKGAPREKGCSNQMSVLGESHLDASQVTSKIFIQINDLKIKFLRLGVRAGPAGSLTNSVYPPRRDARQGAGTQTRRINLVGLNRRPEDGRVGDKGVCKVCARVHAQIMTEDLPRVLICAIDFASIARPNECAARARASQARKYWHQARTTPGTRQMVLQTAADLSHRARPSRRLPALGHE